MQTARLRRRYKRFLADVERSDGETTTVHCPNTGAMLGCSEPGSEVWISDSGNDKRKYRHTLEVVCTPLGRVGVNTSRANRLVEEALLSGRVESLADYREVQREVAIPNERGRFDFLLSASDKRCFVEVKSLTLGYEDGRGAFPDAVSERAVRHVNALVSALGNDQRAVLLFCVQHTGIRRATTADDIHPAYGSALRAAVAAGVEVYAYGCVIERDEIVLAAPMPVEL
ncbi:MAG: DNA/RNA nuclease SfsA [Gammaproteobacteria bacterium]|nr:DNA/RNA nuclease SfsA [Gammaproteobacteria bacterium]